MRRGTCMSQITRQVLLQLVLRHLVLVPIRELLPRARQQQPKLEELEQLEQLELLWLVVRVLVRQIVCKWTLVMLVDCLDCWLSCLFKSSLRFVGEFMDQTIAWVIVESTALSVNFGTCETLRVLVIEQRLMFNWGGRIAFLWWLFVTRDFEARWGYRH